MTTTVEVSPSKSRETTTPLGLLHGWSELKDLEATLAAFQAAESWIASLGWLALRYMRQAFQAVVE